MKAEMIGVWFLPSRSCSMGISSPSMARKWLLPAPGACATRMAGELALSDERLPNNLFDLSSNVFTISCTSSSRSRSCACDLLFCRASIPLNGPLSKSTMYEEAEEYVAFLSFSGTASGKSSLPRSSVRDWKPGTWSKRTSPVLRYRLKSVNLC